MIRDLLTREISSGGVVFRKDNNKIQYLLIRDSSRRWSIPQDRVKKNEKPEEAAIRKIRDETGLSDLKIVRELERIKYFYAKGRDLILKFVYLYLIENRPINPLNPDKEEITGARWFPAKEAMEMVSHKNTREILKKAIIGGIK